MAQLTKKSAFDVLMNKINKKDDSKSNQPKLKDYKKDSNTNKKNTTDENDIIFIAKENPVQDENKNNQNKTNQTEKTSPKKCNQSITIDPLHLQHIQQYSEKELEFLKSLNEIEPKYQLKQPTDPLCLLKDDASIKFDFKSPLIFDFTKHNDKIKPCTCSEFDDLMSKDVTFSLNNSPNKLNKGILIDDTITEEKSDLSQNLNKTIDSLNDTLNDASLELSVSSSHLQDTPVSGRVRYSKRRKTETNPTSSRRVINNEQTQNSKDQLWTEKYQFKDETDIVTNKSQFERLKEWLTNWKSILSKTKETKRSNDDDDSDSDFSCDSDFSNSDSISSASLVNGRKFYSNAILLSGPHGCGKTSSIYSVAKQLGFKIFEVNASSLRCKSQIIQELEGALNSHHVSNNTNNNNLKKLETNKEETNNFKMEKFFKTAEFNKKPKNFFKPKIEMKPKPGKKRKNSLRREVVMSSASSRLKNDSSVIELSSDTGDECLSDKSSSDQSNVNIHRESLILFDEIDVVFREDVGFWAAINHFIKRSKKPIVLTTSDDFLQDKINLNIEKIEYIRPRIDASVRFLKNIAHSESTRLDTSTAYKIIQECKCDMRRALCQLQALISSSDKSQLNRSLLKKYKSLDSNLNLNKFFTNIKNDCELHENSYYVNMVMYLDSLTRRIIHYLHLETSCVFNQEQPVNFKRFDLLILRDGLTDNTSTSVAFNPFLYQQTNESRSREDLVKLNTTFLKENLCDYFDKFSFLMNKKSIDFNAWLNYGTINQFNFVSNVAINRLAQTMFKFTSNKSLCLDYRPFLHEICKVEESKQINNPSKRRFIHYLSYLNIGLVKEDYGLLAKSILDERINEQTITQNAICTESNIFDSDIFSND